MADKKTTSHPHGENASGKPTVTRKAFRVPVDDSFSLTVTVGKENFGAFDIVEGGVGVFQSTRSNLFSIGEELEDLTLHFKGEPLQLHGRVVHIARDEDNSFRYGVQFTKLDSETEAKLAEFVSSARKEYFQNKA